MMPEQDTQIYKESTYLSRAVMYVADVDSLGDARRDPQTDGNVKKFRRCTGTIKFWLWWKQTSVPLQSSGQRASLITAPNACKRPKTTFPIITNDGIASLFPAATRISSIHIPPTLWLYR